MDVELEMWKEEQMRALVSEAETQKGGREDFGKWMYLYSTFPVFAISKSTFITQVNIPLSTCTLVAITLGEYPCDVCSQTAEVSY